ncbi:MAG: hypothetical protein VKS61_09175 [Candidatus Sericytochromatia bacterium]|nr:hypothetical protein [Candidatus Sericytochromatia bacterium]
MRPGVRRGNLVLTAFFLTVGIAVIVGGVQAVLKAQLNNALVLQHISLARLQSTYLAEMGLNHVMYEANRSSKRATANPFTPLGLPAGSSISLDFKDNVAMTRGVSGAVASCLVTRTGTNAFQVDSTLTVPDVGTFRKRLTFAAAYDAASSPPAWELSAYDIQEVAP